jgi:hypothetical protein
MAQVLNKKDEEEPLVGVLQHAVIHAANSNACESAYMLDIAVGFALAPRTIATKRCPVAKFRLCAGFGDELRPGALGAMVWRLWMSPRKGRSRS